MQEASEAEREGVWREVSGFLPGLVLCFLVRTGEAEDGARLPVLCQIHDVPLQPALLGE